MVVRNTCISTWEYVHIARVPGTRERRRKQFEKEGSDELRLSLNYRKTCLGGRERRNQRSIAWNRRERRHWSRYIYDCNVQNRYVRRAAQDKRTRVIPRIRRRH